MTVIFTLQALTVLTHQISSNNVRTVRWWWGWLSVNMSGCPQVRNWICPGRPDPTSLSKHLPPIVCQDIAGFERRGSVILAVLLGVASLGAWKTGVNRGSPKMRLYQIRNEIGGEGFRPGRSKNIVYRAHNELSFEISSSRKNVVIILNFESKTWSGQAYCELSSHAGYGNQGRKSASRASLVSPGGFSWICL